MSKHLFILLLSFLWGNVGFGAWCDVQLARLQDDPATLDQTRVLLDYLRGDAAARQQPDMLEHILSNAFGPALATGEKPTLPDVARLIRAAPQLAEYLPFADEVSPLTAKEVEQEKVLQSMDLSQENKFEESNRLLREAIELNPNEPKYVGLMGMNYYQMFLAQPTFANGINAFGTLGVAAQSDPQYAELVRRTREVMKNVWEIDPEVPQSAIDTYNKGDGLPLVETSQGLTAGLMELVPDPKEIDSVARKQVVDPVLDRLLLFWMFQYEGRLKTAPQDKDGMAMSRRQAIAMLELKLRLDPAASNAPRLREKLESYRAKPE